MTPLAKNLLEKFKADNPKATVSADGRKLNKVKCPRCNKQTAYIHVENPMAIMCHSRNTEGCYGATTQSIEVYPEEFKKEYSKEYPATKENPRATAEAYLKDRGLDISLFEFKQSTYPHEELNIFFNTVMFEQDGIKQHRLIDYKGKDKNRTKGAYTGKAYKTNSFANKKEVWITEGIIDALSLEQIGNAAIATYSSGSVPTTFFKNNADKYFIIAFDNDRAGHSGIDKTIWFFEKSGINYRVALAPKGSDWNDLVKAKKLINVEKTQNQIDIELNQIDFLKNQILGCNDDNTIAQKQREIEICQTKIDALNTSIEKHKELIDECFYRGDLFVTYSPVDYFVLLNKKQPHKKIFEYRNKQVNEENGDVKISYSYALYHGFMQEEIIIKKEQGNDGKTVKKELTEFIPRVTMIADCFLTLRYITADTSIRFKTEAVNIIEINNGKDKPELIAFSAKEITNVNSFREKLANYRQTLYLTKNNIISAELQKYLFKQTAPTLRSLNTLGYDEDSGCYIYHHFLYDKNGNRAEINKSGYFESQKILPISEKGSKYIKAITPASNDFINNTIKTINAVYGYNGLMALSWYIGSLFAKQIFDEYSFYPVLNLYHATKQGKSTLLKRLNTAFSFLEWEGINVTKGNSNVGELRTMSKFSNLAVPLLEWKKESSNLEPRSAVLRAYERGAIKITGQKTVGNDTFEINFKGALCFAQNVYPFETQEDMERVIDLRFEQNVLDAKSDDFKQFIAITNEEWAGLGDFILRNRIYFETGFKRNIEYIKKTYFKDSTIDNRIIMNYTMTMAGLSLLTGIKVENKRVVAEAKAKAMLEKLIEVSQKQMVIKVETARNRLDIADEFIGYIERMSSSKITGVIKEKELAYIHIGRAIDYINKNYSVNYSTLKTQLYAELRKHHTFKKDSLVKRFEINGDKWRESVWEFSINNQTTQDVVNKRIEYANIFINAIDEFAMNENDNIYRDKDIIAFKLIHVIGSINTHYRLNLDIEKLANQLVNHERFISNDKSLNGSIPNKFKGNNLWIFKANYNTLAAFYDFIDNSSLSCLYKKDNYICLKPNVIFTHLKADKSIAVNFNEFLAELETSNRLISKNDSLVGDVPLEFKGGGLWIFKNE